jgi:hypothetical protein
MTAGFLELNEMQFLRNFPNQIPAHQTGKDSLLPRTWSVHVFPSPILAGMNPPESGGERYSDGECRGRNQLKRSTAALGAPDPFWETLGGVYPKNGS